MGRNAIKTETVAAVDTYILRHLSGLLQSVDDDVTVSVKTGMTSQLDHICPLPMQSATNR